MSVSRNAGFVHVYSLYSPLGCGPLDVVSKARTSTAHRASLAPARSGRLRSAGAFQRVLLERERQAGLVDGEAEPVAADQLVVGETTLQVLADHDPDLDSIFRLTREVSSFDFYPQNGKILNLNI